MSLERDAARLESEEGQLIASTAEAKAKIAEIELQSLQIDQDLRSEVAKELADVRAKLAELGERKIAAEDQLNHLDLVAPQDGIVHQLTLHTVGGVIGPGEAIMLIVPNADALTVEAKIQPADIDELHFGQSAVLRFSAFNLGTTPELNGEVTQISADLSHDERTGQSYRWSQGFRITDTGGTNHFRSAWRLQALHRCLDRKEPLSGSRRHP